MVVISLYDHTENKALAKFSIKQLKITKAQETHYQNLGGKDSNKFKFWPFNITQNGNLPGPDPFSMVDMSLQ